MSDKFIEFSKTPVGTAIFIGCFVLICLMYIFTHTSIGRKTLKTLTQRADTVEKRVDDNEKDTKEENKKFKTEIRNELDSKEAHQIDFETFVLDTLGKLNNKKIKQSILDYENKSVEQLTNEEEKVAE